jgi:hypothetical protein
LTNPPRLSQHLNVLSQKIEQQNVRWGEIHKELGVNAPCLAVVLLSVPFLQPIPLPALSTVLGFLMVFLSLGITLNKNLQLPKKLHNFVLPPLFFVLMFKTLSKILKYLEKFIHPRGKKLVEHPSIRFLSGLLIILSSIVLMLPLPPGFNFPPALVCFVLSLGLLEKDIVLLITGFALFTLEVSAIIMAIEWIKQFTGSFL